jgi:hypothetical protein
LLNGGSPHEKLLSLKFAVLTFAIVVCLSTAKCQLPAQLADFNRNEVEL